MDGKYINSTIGFVLQNSFISYIFIQIYGHIINTNHDQNYMSLISEIKKRLVYWDGGSTIYLECKFRFPTVRV